ncbi:family 1 glycosylhydrolase [Streptomyces sp. NPDC006992]|uniref:glycoside hydrolase family 1 protein n=1 Tax=Streptomyces sp. NPDC006992 TaxID=3155601 RepID=UPI0033C7E1AE
MTSHQPLPVFPDGFLWGVSTSAFQIEGALDEDGRGPSAWDAFVRQEGRIKDGSDASVTTDHYHRWPEDVALLRELGVGAYRFSVSWPRVLPSGAGRVNGPGLDFYDRLVDALCEAGIQPVPTLFHWDTPLALEERGGWLRRDTAQRFADYADTVAARLGDRVAHWITLNEPAELTLLGYGLGAHAPGERLLFDALPVAHHQLLGHGLAVRALRARGVPSIGIANSHGPVRPRTDSAADAEAADLYDTLTNRLFADPLLLGRYPDEGLAALLPGPVDEDLKAIGEPLDRYGVNYYQPTLVGAPGMRPAADGGSSGGGPAGGGFAGVGIPAELPFTLHELPGRERTGFGWAVVPEGLPETLHILRDRYGDRLPPVLVTENGCSYPDRTRDARRIAFHDAHLRALHRGIGEGLDVRGYFVWSLLDNFEWAEGCAQRFGLVHVDYPTCERTPKDSFHWFRRALREQRGEQRTGPPAR